LNEIFVHFIHYLFGTYNMIHYS